MTTESDTIYEADTIYEVEGTLSDGRAFRAELWQLGAAYHLTVFMPRVDGEIAEDVAGLIEGSLLAFCGPRFRRLEAVFNRGEALWSYNIVLCDDCEQYVSHLPLPAGVDSFSIWYGERQVRFGSLQNQVTASHAEVLPLSAPRQEADAVADSNHP